MFLMLAGRLFETVAFETGNGRDAVDVAVRGTNITPQQYGWPIAIVSIVHRGTNRTIAA